MKLKFKQLAYQTDATMAVINCFKGQTKGFRKETVGRRTEGEGTLFRKDVIDEIFSNKKLELTEDSKRAGS